MRMTITKPLFNMNWLEFSFLTSAGNEIDASEFIIYPNPGNGLFSLKGSETLDDLSLEIHDLNGRLVFQNSQISKDDLLNYKIDIQGETAGIYIITLKSKNKGTILEKRKLFKR